MNGTDITGHKNNGYTVLTRAQSWRHAGALLMATLLLGACSVENQLPVGASLSIAPTERSLTVSDRRDENGNCLIVPEDYIDWPIVLALTDAGGAPVGNQNVRVYLDFAANTFADYRYPVMALYDDDRGNSNGVVDAYELVSDVDDDVAVVKTDFYGGDRPLLMRINISCPFRGEVFAFVDGVSARATIEVLTDAESSLGVVVTQETN